MKKTLLFLLSMALLLSFSSCGDDIEKLDSVNNSATQNSPVSPIRTGIMNQGVISLENGFECTENGTYYMISKGADSWLLYCDHGSDEIIKLCGRPDCSHDNKDCNAYFSEALNICYYKGYLYTYVNDSAEKGIFRLNLDGTGRVLTHDLRNYSLENGYKGIASPRIWNGIFTVIFKSLDENGKEIGNQYYLSLDNGVESIKPMNTGLLKNDGNAFVGIIGVDSSTKPATYIFGEWNPYDNSEKEYFRSPKMNEADYLGAQAMYYMENGVIYEHFYSGEIKELFDTELRGDYKLRCFPDCIVVSEYLSTEDAENGKALNEPMMYFYDWEFNYLGRVMIDYPFDSIMTSFICGETHERIMLTDSYNLIPKYYINKSDFGSGSIEIHKFKLPDFE